MPEIIALSEQITTVEMGNGIADRNIPPSSLESSSRSGGVGEQMERSGGVVGMLFLMSNIVEGTFTEMRY
ncbi:hypothetical protein FNV43_RR04143 [Rhamnella rubrinervis]|uniref:Uncharacterized protein n=1 Tax=Rhamnella rubrinervis TaxID=2594499 RepID=A0A8K0HJ83_9ROSA|nr:hypothetical protein FNV43_RR04143 [Rhamnella rubrinervis]